MDTNTTPIHSALNINTSTNRSKPEFDMYYNIAKIQSDLQTYSILNTSTLDIKRPTLQHLGAYQTHSNQI
jgi:hypothetical protein